MQQILNVKLILPNVVFVFLLHPRLSEAGYLGAHRPSNNSIVFREAPQAPGLTAVAAETDAWEKKRGNKKRAPRTAVNQPPPVEELFIHFQPLWPTLTTNSRFGGDLKCETRVELDGRRVAR